MSPAEPAAPEARRTPAPRVARPEPLSPRFRVFLCVAVLAGFCLRLLWVQDMEFKEDEWFDYLQTALIGRHQPWPWYGMPSGVYIVNPGMSVWVFVWLARLFHATTPTGLAHALSLTSLAGILLIFPFARFFLRLGADYAREREIWLWAMALALVNPFLIYLHRKLWPEPFFPLFTMIMLMAWWRRGRPLGALVWGCVGAVLGQIHMSGFFFAAAVFLWTLWSDLAGPKRSTEDGEVTSPARWGWWVLGSLLGALPLAPWAWHVLTTPAGGPVSVGWWENASQLKFWVFWITDPLGFHLGNAVGLLRGQSHWAQLSDFVRYPRVFGHDSYLNLVAHLTILATGSWVVLWGVVRAGAELRQRRSASSSTGTLRVDGSETGVVQNSALWGFGALLTLSGINIRRYYMAVSFPLEFTWLARLALVRAPRGRACLAALWAAQLVVSACFVLYVHQNRGAEMGDYGKAYHVVVHDNLCATGKPWPGYDPAYAPDYDREPTLVCEARSGAELKNPGARTGSPEAPKDPLSP